MAATGRGSGGAGCARVHGRNGTMIALPRIINRRNGTMQTQPTLAVANYLIGKAQSEGRSITPMQLIKLVYIAHGWTLGLYDQPLIGEQVEAWTYGPGHSLGLSRL